MHQDDHETGSILSRREALLLMGAAGVTVWAGGSISRRASALPNDCVVRPEQTEGPYFVDELLNRSDIRVDPSDGTVRPGVPLDLQFNVSGILGDTCGPVPGLYVDVWHCDALGVYSDVAGAVGTKFLRGYQITDADGIARFTTIYPGWYTGRTVHIHFKIRSALSATPGFEFTSQLYFDDAVTDLVQAQAPYTTKGKRDTRNAQDGIYRGGGIQLLLATTPTPSGYAAALDIALDGITPVERTTWGLLKRWAG